MYMHELLPILAFNRKMRARSFDARSRALQLYHDPEKLPPVYGAFRLGDLVHVAVANLNCSVYSRLASHTWSALWNTTVPRWRDTHVDIAVGDRLVVRLDMYRYARGMRADHQAKLVACLILFNDKGQIVDRKWQQISTNLKMGNPYETP